MAIFIKTTNPELLLNCINEAISSFEIDTWDVDKDGDYTIDRDQWRYRAWLRSYVNDGQLVFGIVQSRKFLMTNELYGVYHGRFVATIMAHFSDVVQEIRVTSNPTKGFDVLDFLK